MSDLHKLTIHHVRAIRGRLALMGMTANQLAKRAGVGSSSVSSMLRGHQIGSRHVPKLLKALDIDLNTTSERLRLEVELVSTIRHLVFKGRMADLRVATRMLGALLENVTSER